MIRITLQAAMIHKRDDGSITPQPTVMFRVGEKRKEYGPIVGETFADALRKMADYIDQVGYDKLLEEVG